MPDWFYAENDEQKGPINEAELKEKFVAKTLPSDALVWQDGMENWVEANTLPNFKTRKPPPMTSRIAGAPSEAAPTAQSVAAAQPAPAAAPETPATPTPAPAASKPSESQTIVKEKKQVEEPEDIDALDDLGDIIKEPPVIEVEEKDFKRNKIWAILGYLYVFFVITLIVAARSPFARYHGAQGMTLFFVTTLYWVFLAGLSFVLAGILPDVVFFLLALAPPLTLCGIGISNAVKGKAVPLPVIGKFTLLR